MSGQNKKVVDLVLDTSGSMRGEKLRLCKRIFLRELDKRLCSKDNAGVLAFDTNFRELHPLNRFTRRNKTKMERVVKSVRAEGGTALYDALGQSVDRLVNNWSDKDIELLILCLTDGIDNSSDKFTTPNEVKDYANSKGVDLKILLIGIGEDVDENALEIIADGTGGKYIPADPTKGGIGGAAEKAGDLITGRKGGRSGRTPEKGRVYGRKRNFNRVRPMASENTNKRSWIKFEGNISRRDMEYMEKIAGRAVGLISEENDLVAGSVTVPVYILDEKEFEQVFGKWTRPSKYCQELYGLILRRDSHPRDVCERVEEDELPRSVSVGIGDGLCSGEVVACFVDDMVFHRFKDKMEKAGIPEVTPGIYIKDMKRRGRKGSVNIRCLMSTMAVSSTIYYSTSRISAVKRSSISAVNDLTSGTISLLCNDEKTIDEFTRYCTLGGLGVLPLHLIKEMNGSSSKRVLSKLYEELPVRYLMNGDITEDNERDHVSEVKTLLEKLMRDHL